MNNIEDLIQNVLDGDFNKANDVFAGLVADKQSDVLAQEKIAIANQIFNGSVEAEEPAEGPISNEADQEDEVALEADAEDPIEDDINIDDINVDDIDLEELENQE